MIEVILLTSTPSFITKNYVPSTGSKPHTAHMGNAASILVLSDSLTVLTFPSARLSSFRSTAGESKRSCLASTWALKAARLTRVLVLKQKLGHHYAGPPERRSPTRASVGLNGLPEPCDCANPIHLPLDFFFSTFQCLRFVQTMTMFDLFPTLALSPNILSPRRHHHGPPSPFGAPAGPAAPCSLRKGLLLPAASSHRILLHATAAA